MLRPSLLVGAFLVLGLLGCGGGGGGGSERTKAISISAGGGTILPGGTLSLTAIVQGGGSVAWSVDGGDANGTVTPRGLYTAPATQGTYTVRATAGGVSATKTVVVTTGVAVALTSPATVPLTVPRSKLSFAAGVTGSSNRLVTWTTTGGTVAADGTFTAPDAPGTYTVTATSQADTTKKATATVQVAANANVRIKWLNKDDVVLSLRPDKAPNTVANYVTLVNRGFYDGIVAHRYEEAGSPSGVQVIQWGDPLTKTLPLTDPSIGSGGPGYTIPFEANDLSNVQYSLAMARNSGPDTAGSQVYINLVDQPFLDHTDTNQGYVVFGAVASGQSVVDSLRKGDKIVSARVEAAP